MEIKKSEYGEIVVASLGGDLDGQTAPVFEVELLPLARPGEKVVLDMHSVDFLSSAGLRQLLLLCRQMSAVGGRVVLADMPEMIEDIIGNTGFLEFFEAYEDLPAALAALNGNNNGNGRLNE